MSNRRPTNRVALQIRLCLCAARKVSLTNDSLSFIRTPAAHDGQCTERRPVAHSLPDKHVRERLPRSYHPQLAELQSSSRVQRHARSWQHRRFTKLITPSQRILRSRQGRPICNTWPVGVSSGICQVQLKSWSARLIDMVSTINPESPRTNFYLETTVA